MEHALQYIYHGQVGRAAYGDSAMAEMAAVAVPCKANARTAGQVDLAGLTDWEELVLNRATWSAIVQQHTTETRATLKQISCNMFK